VALSINQNFNLQATLEIVRDELRGVWRYRWTGVLVAWLVAGAGWLAVFAMPDVYEARARVYVDASTALRPLLQGLAIDSGVQSQLDLVRQALLSRPQLERVALKVDLMASATNPVEREKLLEGLRSQIKLSGDTSHSGDNLYTLSYQATSRERSVAVVRVVLDSFMEDVIGMKQAGQATAQRFLRDEIQQYERRLSEAESRLADFKKKNMGLMPGDRGDYFSRMQTETEQLETARGQLRLAERKRAQLAVQLSGENSSLPGSNSSAGSSVDTETGALLRDAQARLQDLLLRYTDKHPEVIALREQIAQLEQRRTREEENFRRLAASGRTGAASANPVYQRLQVDLNAAEVEVATLNGDVADRLRRIEQLKLLVNTAPEVEAELARLNRDYGVTKSQYDSLVQRLETARLSERAEETGVVKFDVIDPPVATLEPIAPNRILLLVAALIGGLLAGLGVAYLRHFGKPAVHSARQLQSLAGKANVVVLGLTSPSSWHAAMAASRRRLAVAAGLLVAAFTVVLVTQSTVTQWVQGILR
jgi:polysaccharide chain length determinant protein (PEP-CTERM system associated)